jgi:hypothetical protein
MVGVKEWLCKSFGAPTPSPAADNSVGVLIPLLNSQFRNE